MNIILASNNSHKYQEMQGILRTLPYPITLLCTTDLEFSYMVIEDGTTFATNSLHKAHALYHLLQGKILHGVTADKPVQEIARMVKTRFPHKLPFILADDSGICVHALNNQPGVSSARFGYEKGQPPLTAKQQSALLLKKLQGASDRSAHYICNAILMSDPEHYVQVQETWDGYILEKEQAGSTGFGYDPIFCPSNEALDKSPHKTRQSVAEIPQKVKDAVSHRAKALKRLIAAYHPPTQLGGK